MSINGEQGGVKKILLFVVNVDWFFVSHRLPIALQASRQGYEVHVACAMTGLQDQLEGYGFNVHPLPIERGSSGIANVVQTIQALIALFTAIKPDITHLVTIKPVLLGGFVARLTGVKRVVAAISGLGYVFIAQGFSARLRRFIIGKLYGVALHRPLTRVVFQNADDCRIISSMVRLSPEQSVLVKGSGVDLDRFVMTQEPSGTPVVVLLARLLRDKGILEFCEAASIIGRAGFSARFCLIGDYDYDNPAALSRRDCESIAQESGVELWGKRSDIPEVLSQANIVALPSYREGLPKVLIEAAACGRAVVTTDVPGCRDAIVPDVTGLLVPVRNAQALAEAILRLLKDSELRRAMGVAGRKFAEDEFDIRGVVERHMEIYKELTALG